MAAGAGIVWAPLVPELSCADLARSLGFYVGTLGFGVVYDRPEAGFAFLALGGAQLMLEQANGHWETGALQHPYGRGINFQIEVADLDALAQRLAAAGVALFAPPETATYRVRDGQRVQRQLLVPDPDGYLLRFCQPLAAG